MQMLIYVIVALVAALLGGLAGMLYQDDKWRNRKRSNPVAAHKPAAAALSAADEDELEASRRELSKLRRENADLRRENAELQRIVSKGAAEVSQQSRRSKQRKAPPAPAAVPPALPPASDELAAQPIAATDAHLPASVVCYASAVPGGALDDAQLVEQPMSRMPLAITLDPANPARATFTLSPGVDQSWLIEAGLDRLRDYFDYALPPSWPSSVTATLPGQLVREAGGWRVHPNHKGQLEVR